MRALLFLSAVFAAAAPLSCCRRLAEDEASFPFLPRLTPEEAATLEGVWVLTSPKDQRRLDGSLYDGIVLDALNASKKVDIEEHLAEQAAKAAEDESSTLVNWKLLIPSVDKRTGMFAAYKINLNVNSSGAGAWQPGAPIVPIKRFVGAAKVLSDGSITWEGVEDVDSSLYQGFIPGNHPTVMQILRLEGVEIWDTKGDRTLDSMSVVEIRVHKDEKANMLEELKKLKSSLPLKTVREGTIRE